MEIAQKRTALENVLVPETLDVHRQRLLPVSAPSTSGFNVSILPHLSQSSEALERAGQHHGVSENLAGCRATQAEPTVAIRVRIVS